MNINKITRQIYINDYKDSKLSQFSDFIRIRIKNIDSKIECILNCYMLFNLKDWEEIITWKLYDNLILDYPHLSIYKLICESKHQIIVDEYLKVQQMMQMMQNRIPITYTISDTSGV